MTTNIQQIVPANDNFTILFDRLNEVINALNTIVITTSGGNTSISGLLLADSAKFIDLAANTSILTVLSGNTFSYTNGTIGTAQIQNMSVTGNASMNVATIRSGTANTFHANVATFNSLLINGQVPWTPGNDGAGSGLDADLLDGQDGAYYTDIPARLGYNPLDSAAFTGANILSRLLTVDGSGSNLDADFLDGQQGSYYQNAGNLNAGVLAAARLGTNITYDVGGLRSAGVLSGYSDARLKTHIETITSALDKVKQLRGVYFEMGGRQMLGVVAQELNEVIPEAIVDGDYLSVMYGNLVGLLIEAVKELDDRYANRLLAIEERLDALEGR